MVTSSYLKNYNNNSNQNKFANLYGGSNTTTNKNEHSNFLQSMSSYNTKSPTKENNYIKINLFNSKAGNTNTVKHSDSKSTSNQFNINLISNVNSNEGKMKEKNSQPVISRTNTNSNAQAMNESVDDFCRDLNNDPQKESYIARFSPKKKRIGNNEAYVLFFI
jgi:hypothetical protein